MNRAGFHFLNPLLLLFFFLGINLFSYAQDDKVIIKGDTVKTATPVDTSAKAEKKIRDTHSPRKAVIRSAILPGWGQVYNKKYWKVPIVYGALGTSAGIFIFNMKWYRRTRYAYTVAATQDSANFVNVHPQLRPFVLSGQKESLRYYRDQYRRDIDYSVLFFVALWGLNVVDAAVDAHLKGFDVSPDLSLHVKPGYSDMAGTNGLSLVLRIK